jgi:hypothetical protein
MPRNVPVFDFTLRMVCLLSGGRDEFLPPRPSNG